MAKLTTSDLTSLTNETSAVNTINNNNALIETALENTLSRDGTTPNTMSADLDMNGQQLLNAVIPAGTFNFGWQGQWLTATDYLVNHIVYNNGNSYVCLVAHTSGTFDTDLSANRWELLASKGETGATGLTGATGATGATGPQGPQGDPGTGDMTSTNNLSDVADVDASVVNLGIKTSTTGSFITPSGTTAQRDGSPVNGYFRYNSSTNEFEGYANSAWGSIGGAGGGYFKGENGTVGSSAGDIFRINEAELNTDVTIDAAENASATGPLGVASGVTLTVSGTLVII